MTILHHFSAWGPVTEHEVDTAVDTFRAQCRNGSLLGAATFCDHVGAYQGKVPRELKPRPLPWQGRGGQERAVKVARGPSWRVPEGPAAWLATPTLPKGPSLIAALPVQPSTSAVWTSANPSRRAARPEMG